METVINISRNSSYCEIHLTVKFIILWNSSYCEIHHTMKLKCTQRTCQIWIYSADSLHKAHTPPPPPSHDELQNEGKKWQLYEEKFWKLLQNYLNYSAIDSQSFNTFTTIIIWIELLLIQLKQYYLKSSSIIDIFQSKIIIFIATCIIIHYIIIIQYIIIIRWLTIQMNIRIALFFNH